MQCILLAAGKGTRLRPLTDSLPKPLVPVLGKPILAHIIELLPPHIDELIIVHGYLGEKIKEYFGDTYNGRSITYVEQIEQKGTGHALWLCREHIHGRFLYLFADDFHGEQDLFNVLAHDRAMLTYPTTTPERFGVVVKDENDMLVDFVEKSPNPPSNLASTGVFVLDERIFEYAPTVETNGEFYHTDMIKEYAKKYPIKIVEQTFWHPIGYPEDVEAIEQMFRKQAAHH